MNHTRKQAQRIATCGMLLALMLVLGFVESQLPVAAGIPGIKLGLSNGVLIFAVYMLGSWEAALIWRLAAFSVNTPARIVLTALTDRFLLPAIYKHVRKNRV